MVGAVCLNRNTKEVGWRDVESLHRKQKCFMLVQNRSAEGFDSPLEGHPPS